MSRPQRAGERESLLSRPNAQREHVLGFLEGLPDQNLRRMDLPLE